MRLRKRIKRRLIFVLVFVVGIGCHAAYRMTREAFQTSELGFLMLAAIQNGDAAFTKKLLKDGVDPNFNFNGMTPLKKARMGEQDEIIKMLQAAGARE